MKGGRSADGEQRWGGGALLFQGAEGWADPGEEVFDVPLLPGDPEEGAEIPIWRRWGLMVLSLDEGALGGEGACGVVHEVSCFSSERAWV